MEKTDIRYQTYLKILKEELVPAMGCTEPIALAYAAAEARRILGPEKIIGASAHNREEALEAQRQGADYLGSGAVFGSSTKKDATTLSREELTAVCRAVSIPVAAIGGITEENCLELAGTGVSGIAVVSALFAAADQEEAAARLRALAEKIAERS